MSAANLLPRLCVAASTLWFSSPTLADAIAVQCTVDSYSSSYAPRPDSFVIMVDTDARTVATYYGSVPMKITRKVIRGAARVEDGWQSNVEIDRNTGKFEAGTDKVDGRKHSYAMVKGKCILPAELQGPRYGAPAL